MVRIINNIKSLVAVLALTFAFSFAPVVTAGAIGINDGANSAKGSDQAECLVDTADSACTSGDPIFQTITNVMLFLIGAIAVIMLIIGGIRYTVSGGDQAAVKSAKDTILYAVVGIIVAILAYAIVNFVIGSFVK